MLFGCRTQRCHTVSLMVRLTSDSLQYAADGVNAPALQFAEDVTTGMLSEEACWLDRKIRWVAG